MFDYSLTNGSFDLYNTNHTKPRFLEDLVQNLTALFSNSSQEEIETYNTTCEGYEQCLLAIARTGNLQQGQLIMQNIHEEQFRKELAG